MNLCWRICSIAAIVLLAASGHAATGADAPAAPRPSRVVSLDYCADQFVLQLVGRDHIAALSPDAQEPFSYLRDAAAGLPQVVSKAEDILLLNPDTVVSSYNTTPALDRLLKRAGVEVLRIGWIDSLESLRGNLLSMGAALGNSTEATRLLRDFDERLARLRIAQIEEGPRALYVTPGGVSAGRDTVVDELLRAAGLRNFETRSGWRDLPLERLAYERPDVVINARFAADQHPWSAARHPLLQRQLGDLPAVSLPGAWTACGGWFLIEAIEAMAVLAR